MRNFKLNKKSRIFLLIMVAFPFIVLFCNVIVPDLINPPKPGENYLRDKIKINCQGKVLQIFRQKMNHNIPELYDSRTFKDRYLEREENIECIGVIKDIYRQKDNHNILTLRTKDCKYEIHSSWEGKFQIGDSISKKKGIFL